ncbi:MAG: leucine-rich repeat domain-containing protein, partial [Eubacterium sp.]|nr:leucine-rich repeat domain-containing protein [Eubacterium sp.]
MKTQKKLLSLLLAVLMVVTMMPLSAIPVFAAKKADATGNCGVNGNNATYLVEDTDNDGKYDKITIRGSGDMVNWDYNTYNPWYNGNYDSDIKTIVVNSGITSIGDYAFYSCDKATSVTIPDTVTKIGNNAFYFCYEANITIPSKVTSIGDNAFSNCRKLNNITLPGTLTSLGNFAFKSCSGLESIVIPDSVTSIGQNVFDGCRSLKSATLPSGLTVIPHGMFSNCRSLTGITFPAGVTGISMSAFYGCSSLNGITIPSGVRNITDTVFQNCTSLTSITIPAGVTYIGYYAFKGCTSLETITFERPSTAHDLEVGGICFPDEAKLAYSGEGSLALAFNDTTIEEGASLADYDAEQTGRRNKLEWKSAGEAAIGTTVYTTFAEALAAAQTGDTITLLKDVAVDSTIVVNDGRNITIDTNGNDITSTVRVFEIRHGGVTLTGDGTVSTTAVSAVAVYGSAN